MDMRTHPDPQFCSRKAADGLAALVRETLRLDPFSGMVFVFRAKPADHVDERGRNKTE